jgi:hypothetical protein
MTRICTLISTLILLVFASPSHAVTFHFSIALAGDDVEGFVSDLEDTIAYQSAESVVVTASPIGGLGEYAPGQYNEFQAVAGIVTSAEFTSHVINGYILFFGFGTGSLVPVFPGAQPVSGAVVFTALDAETPLPGALPLFATGLGALGLLTWRRKRSPIAS